MVNSTDLLNEIETQEKKGFFKSLRKRRLEVERFQPTLGQLISNISFHVQNALKITGEFKVLNDFDKVMVFGTGINGVAGDMLSAYVDLDIKVYKNFEFPDNANSKSLVFIVSHTGNDEVAISAYKSAQRKGCHVIGITSGGRLMQILEKGGKEHIKLPEKVMEEASFPYLFFPMLKILDNSKQIKSQKEHIEDAIKALKKPEIKEMGRQLYEKLQDKIPIIYSSGGMGPVAALLKTLFNMVSKVPAYQSSMPEAAAELNTYLKDMWDFYVVFLTDQDDSDLSRKSVTAAKTIIKNKSYGTTEISIKGTSKLARLATGAGVAMYASYYLGEYYRIDEDLYAKYKQTFKG